MKSVEIVSISIPISLLKEIDAKRHDVSRSKFVQRILENAFGQVTNEKTEFQSKSSDYATEANNVPGKGTELKMKKTGTVASGSIPWLNS